MQKPEVKPDHELAMKLLVEAVKAAGKKGKAAVAPRLGVSRCYLARVLSPNDACKLSDAVAIRIVDRYHVIPECPAVFQPMPRSDCHRIALGAAPTHNPSSMHIWRVCQTCPHKPEALPPAPPAAPKRPRPAGKAAPIVAHEEESHAATA